MAPWVGEGCQETFQGEVVLEVTSGVGRVGSPGREQSLGEGWEAWGCRALKSVACALHKVGLRTGAEGHTPRPQVVSKCQLVPHE